MIKQMRLQIKNKLKKAVSLAFMTGTVTAAVLAAGTLSGCGGGAGTAGNENPTGSTGTTAASGETGGAAKGRYMEEEIALPEELQGMYLMSSIQKEDKSLECYFSRREGDKYEYAVYTYGKDGWKQQELFFQIPDTLEAMSDVLLGEDGSYYVGGYTEEYVYQLFAVDEKGGTEEVFHDVFRVPEGKEYGLLPDYLAVLSDGSLLVSQSSKADVYDRDGVKKASVAQDFIGMDVRHFAYTDGNSYLTLLNEQIARYDMMTGAKTGSFVLPEQMKQEMGDGTLFTGEGGDVYVAGRNGLFHTGKDGTIWEQLIDGNLNSMGRQDIYLVGFYRGAESDYYGFFQKSQEPGTLLYHYVYDETVDTVPPTTLTVYALRDSRTVRQAASMMQKNNPNVRVDFRIAVENSEDAVTEDVIRALNTELLNGKGADVLILDGLPAESYREKGILSDLSGVVEQVRADLLPNLTGGFTEEDGRIYYLPARIKVPVIYGSPEAVTALTTLDGMAAYDGTPSLLTLDIYENVLQLTAHTCYTELFGSDGSIDEKTLTRWLEAVKAAGERAGVKVAFEESEFEKLNINNYVIPGGFGRQSDFAFAQEKCAVAAELLNSIDDAMLPVVAAGMKNCPIQGINQTYLPTVMVGINASSKQQEAAEEFVRTLFSSEVQNEMLWDGFAVRTDSLEKWGNEEKESTVGVSMGGLDFTLQAGWPSMEDREKLLAIVRTADKPILIDKSVLDMIISGSKDYLNGKEPVERAVQAIENQIRLYMAERE